MNNNASKAPKVAATGSAKNKPRYYTEGVIKDVWLESMRNVRFTVTPDSEYSIGAENKGEKKTCPVFRHKDFAERLCANGVADLYAGDFTFSAPECMTFDQLLLIKINACHVRICVESKDSLLDSETPDGKMNMKSLVQASEIRLKQK